MKKLFIILFLSTLQLSQLSAWTTFEAVKTQEDAKSSSIKDKIKKYHSGATYLTVEKNETCQGSSCTGSTPNCFSSPNCPSNSSSKQNTNKSLDRSASKEYLKKRDKNKCYCPNPSERHTRNCPDYVPEFRGWRR